jgi:hypothetical protein
LVPRYDNTMAKLYNTLHAQVVRSTMQFKAKLLKKYIKELVLEVAGSGPKKLRIFDFDDTLVQTDAMVYVTNAEGEEFALTPGEFAVYTPKKGDAFDYTDFQELINPRAIKWTGKILDSVYQKHGPQGLVVLTARGVAEPIRQFLNDAGYPDVEVIALGDANPQAKASWIDQKITSDDLDVVEFFDDSSKYIAAVKRLQTKHPDVKIITRHIVHRFSSK